MKRVRSDWLFWAAVAVAFATFAFNYYALSHNALTKAALSGAIVCRAIVMDADGTIVCIPKE